jgi:hypothetical protein
VRNDQSHCASIRFQVKDVFVLLGKSRQGHRDGVRSPPTGPHKRTAPTIAGSGSSRPESNMASAWTPSALIASAGPADFRIEDQQIRNSDDRWLVPLRHSSGVACILKVTDAAAPSPQPSWRPPSPASTRGFCFAWPVRRPDCDTGHRDRFSEVYGSCRVRGGRYAHHSYRSRYRCWYVDPLAGGNGEGTILRLGLMGLRWPRLELDSDQDLWPGLPFRSALSSADCGTC